MVYKDKYKLEADGTFGYYSIKPVGKGSVHKSLRGLYTTTTAAMKAIDAFTGENTNAKAKSSD